MSRLLHTIASFVAGLLASDQVKIHPDTMSLHDWADLPPHHPICDSTPC